MEKFCWKCKKDIDLSLFWICRKNKDWFNVYCKECCRLYNRESSKKYNRNNKDIKNIKSKIYAENHQEKIIKYRKEYFITNREKILEDCKKRYVETKEYQKNRYKAYYNTINWRISRINNMNKRRSRIKSSCNLSINTSSLKEVLDKQNNKCAICYCLLDLNKKRFVHLDHIIPISRGWTHTISNVQWTCQYCNCSKWNKIINNI